MKSYIIMICLLAMLAPAAEVRAQTAAPAAETGEAISTASVPQSRAARRSWTADRRDFVVGDIITVLLDEFTLASADLSDVAFDRRRRDVDIAVGGSGLAASIPATGAGFSTRNDADSRRRGEASRANQFRGEISVRVTEIGPNGLMRVEGEKLVAVDKNQQEIQLSGWVRPEDVSAGNLIESYRVGDAQLVYSSKGSLGKPKGGILGRILGAIWP